MDKKNVQKSICQNLFGKKRAALGKIFGTVCRIWMRSYMMSSKQKSFLKNCYHNSKMGANGRGMSLFGGFLFSEKRFWRFWGMPTARMGRGMSLFGGFVFSEKRFLRFWGMPTAHVGRGMSLFGGFLFSEKRFWRFRDRFHFVSGFLVSMCFKAAVDDMSMRVGFALWMASGRLC